MSSKFSIPKMGVLEDADVKSKVELKQNESEKDFNELFLLEGNSEAKETMSSKQELKSKASLTQSKSSVEKREDVERQSTANFSRGSKYSVSFSRQDLDLTEEAEEKLERKTSSLTKKVDSASIIKDSVSLDSATLGSLLKSTSREITPEEMFGLTQTSKEEVEEDQQTGERSLGSFQAHRPRFDSTRFSLGTDTSASLFSEWTDRASLAMSEFQPGRSMEADPDMERILQYDLYDVFKKQAQAELIKNNYLCLKIGEYYNKRRFYNFLMSDSNVPEIKEKYESMLEQLSILNEAASRVELELVDEVQYLQHQVLQHREATNNLFETLQKMELNLGQEIINSTVFLSNRAHVEKMVHRLISRQKHQIESMTKQREAFIRARNKLNEVQEKIDELDTLGPNRRIMDFVQLKVDNRNLHDKMEEKEKMLNSTRSQCKDAMQVLAHNREKAAALDMEIKSQKENLEGINDELEYVREQVQMLRSSKDQVRQSTNELKEQCGLLYRPLFLKDMERAIIEINEGNEKLDQYKRKIETSSQKLEAVRAKLADYTEQRKLFEDSTPK